MSCKKNHNNHSVRILASLDPFSDARAARDLQRCFNELGIGAFLTHTCGLGRRGFARSDSNESNISTWESLPAENLPPPFVISDEIAELAHSASTEAKIFVALVSKDSLALMSRRLTLGIADRLFDELTNALGHARERDAALYSYFNGQVTLISSTDLARFEPRVSELWKELQTRQVDPTPQYAAALIASKYFDVPAAHIKLAARYAPSYVSASSNYPEAIRLLRLAAEKDSPVAEKRLAEIFANGEGGVEKDVDLAIQYLKSAAEHNDPDSQDKLAKLYARGGDGVSQNLHEARRLFEMLKLRNWNHASVILDRMDNDPHNSCVNLSPKHPAGHEVYISYAREVDTQAAISLQTSFDTFKVSSFIDKTCGLGLKGYGYITSKTRKSILGIPVPSRVPGSSTTATSIPSPPASIPLHPNEIIALEGVSKAVVLLVSPFAVKLMDRRLMCGLADSLYEEWKRALVISQSQCIKLLVLRVVSERDAELPTNVCEAVKSILSELDLAGTPFTVPLSVVASVVEDGGNAAAMFKLAQELIKQNERAKSVLLLRRAAELGDAGAQCSLINHADLSIIEEALWLQKSAHQGYMDAQWRLGLILATGRGIAKDPREAVRQFELASCQGHQDAAVKLGDLWMEGGEGVDEISPGKAVEFYKLAVFRGSSEAKGKLAVCYKQGLGVKADVRKAYAVDSESQFLETLSEISARKKLRFDNAGDGSDSEDDGFEGSGDGAEGDNSKGADRSLSTLVHTSIIQSMKQVFEDLDSPFVVSGRVPVSVKLPINIFYQPQGDQIIRKITFPSNDSNQLETLLKSCTPASFGFKSETVFDDSYRKALKLDAARISSTFDINNAGILDQIKRTLLSRSTDFVRAELHKLNVYGPGGFFKAHVDTPLSSEMFGSLVICLPVAFAGGKLTIAKGKAPSSDSVDSKDLIWGSSVVDDIGSAWIQWAAFFSDCPHEISPVTSGHRITITYNLFRKPQDEILFVPRNFTGSDNIFYLKLKKCLGNPNFFEKGAYLIFHCKHAYQIPSVKEDKTLFHPLIHNLKGSDLLIFQSAIACELRVFMKPVYDGFSNKHGPVYFIGKKFVHGGTSAQYDQKLDFLRSCFDTIPVANDRENVVWFGKPLAINTHEYAAHGNESSVDYIYSSAALIVAFPGWEQRAHLFE